MDLILDNVCKFTNTLFSFINCTSIFILFDLKRNHKPKFEITSQITLFVNLIIMLTSILIHIKEIQI